MQLYDKNGIEIRLTAEVNVPEPNETDIHQHEFTGSILQILENGNVIVVDGDSDCFEIEANRLEIVVDEYPKYGVDVAPYNLPDENVIQ